MTEVTIKENSTLTRFETVYEAGETVKIPNFMVDFYRNNGVIV